MLLTIALILALLWLLGALAHIGGGFLYLLLIIAIILAIVELSGGRRRL